jgi:hypothetical protein
MSIYEDLAMPVELRTDAAKAALRYERPAIDNDTPYLVVTDKNLEQIDFPDGPPRFLVRMPAPVKASTSGAASMTRRSCGLPRRLLKARSGPSKLRAKPNKMRTSNERRHCNQPPTREGPMVLGAHPQR